MVRGDFSRAAVMIRHHARVSNDAGASGASRRAAISQRCRAMVWIQLKSDVTGGGDRGGDEHDDAGDHAGSKYARDER